MFEDEQNGFIPLAMKSATVEDLKTFTVSAINRLYARENDAADRDRTLVLLSRVTDFDEMAPDLAAKKKFVARLLGNIKTERIERARAYLERKRKRALIERRARKKKIRRWSIYASGGAGVAALAAAIYLLGSNIHEGMKKEARLEDIRVSIEAAREGEKPEKKKAEKKADGKDVDAFILNPVQWTFAPGGKKARIAYYSPVMGLSSPDMFPAICQYMPSILDKLNAAMSADLPKDRQPEAADLDRAAARAAVEINRSLGGEFLTFAALRTDIDSVNIANQRRPCRPFPGVAAETRR